MAAYINQEMAKRGLKQVGEVEQFAPDIADYVPLMTRVLAAKPDAIYCMISGPIAPGSEIRAARDLGFKGPLLYTTHADVDLQSKIAGPGTTDMFGAGLTLADPSSMPQAVKDLQTAYLAKFPADQLIADIQFAYDGLWILLQTIEKAGSVDPATIVKTYEGLTKLGDLQTTVGPGYVGGLKTVGTNRVICSPWALSRVTNGKSSNVKFIMLDIP